MYWPSGVNLMEVGGAGVATSPYCAKPCTLYVFIVVSKTAKSPPFLESAKTVPVLLNAKDPCEPTENPCVNGSAEMPSLSVKVCAMV